jgi:NADH:ubiquinone oxidoreductase subunit
MTIGTKLYTAFFGSRIGKDDFGNRYYTSKNGRRWVIYKGIAEASKVPAEWHRWLHKTTNDVPKDIKKRDWEKPHLPNLSGTEYSYAPKGHIKKGHNRNEATGDYIAWEPKE